MSANVRDAGADASALELEEALSFLDECDDDVFDDASTVKCPPLSTSLPTRQQRRARKSRSSNGSLMVKKKRIRRQKVELEHLRKLVLELESKLAVLRRYTGGNKRCPDPSSATSTGSNSPKHEVPSGETSSQDASTSLTSTSRSIAPTDAERALSYMTRGMPSSAGNTKKSIWEGVADRQLQEELRVVKENQRLKARLESQTKLISSLQKILEKRASDEAVKALTGAMHPSYHWGLTSETDTNIFRDQLAHVTRAYADADRVFRGTVNIKDSFPFHEIHVEPCDDDSPAPVAFEMESCSVVPFDLHVAGRALWRMLAVEGVTQNSYFHREVEATDNLIARSFGLHLYLEGLKADFRGKHTFRRYIEESRIIIVWKTLVDPVAIDKVDFRGVQCEEVGWVQLRRAGYNEEGQPASTLVQIRSSMTPQLHNGIVEPTIKLELLVSLILKFNNLLAKLCCSLVCELLVEEDWKSQG